MAVFFYSTQVPGLLALALLQVRNLGGSATQPLTTLPDYNKSDYDGLGDGCKHKENASLHLATVKQRARYQNTSMQDVPVPHL